MWEAAGERTRPTDLAWVAGPVLAGVLLTMLAPREVGLVAWALTFIAMALLPLVWLRRRVPRDPWWPGLASFGREALTGLVMMGAVTFYSALLGPDSGAASGTSKVLGEATDGNASTWPIVVFVMAVSFGPLAEELFFRGFLMHALGRWTSRWVALVVQAFAFAAVHRYDWSGTLTVAGAGMLLGLLVMWRRGLVAAIVAHVGVNAYAAYVAARAEGPRPIVGVYCTATASGCAVTNAPSGGPAYGQGIRAGDVIVTFEGLPVSSQTQLSELVSTYGRPGQLVQLAVARDGVLRVVLVRLGVIDD